MYDYHPAPAATRTWYDSLMSLHAIYKKMNKERLAKGEPMIVHDLASGPQPKDADKDQAALIIENNVRIIRRQLAKKDNT